MKINYFKSKLATMFVFVLIACSAQAQTFVKIGATGANNGTTWTNAYTNLQVAIDAATAGDSIFVAKGVYQLGTSLVMKEGVKIYGSFQGTETYLFNRVFGTNAGDTTVLKGDNFISIISNNNNGLTAAAILDGFKITEGGNGISNSMVSPSLSNLTITKCQQSGILNFTSSPTLLNIKLAGNDKGMSNQFSSSPILTNVSISGSTTDGIINTSSNPILTNVTITGSLDAAIDNNSSSVVIIDNSIIIGNSIGIDNDGTSSTVNQYSLIQQSADILNGNIDATGVLASTIFVNAITPGNSISGNFALKACAITVDAGSNALITLGNTKDLAGNARIFNTTVDMGAYEVQALPTPIVGTTVLTDVVCNGASTGAIDLTVSGGLAPYTYDWGGGITTQDRTGLAAGTYAVTIKDANECTTTVSAIVIAEPATAISATSTQTNITTCHGDNTGSASVVASGGTSPYTYAWSPAGGTAATATALTARTYSVTIKDSKLCQIVVPITITQPALISSTVDTVSCVSVTFNGQVYSTSGIYTQMRTAANNCDSTVFYNVTITGPTTSTTNYELCSGTSYVWNGTTYSTAGTYTYLTTNAAGCDSTATLVFTIGTTTSTTTTSACSSYKWNGVVRTTSGTYTFNTLNAAGCDSTATLVLTIGTPFAASVTIVNQNKLQAVAAGSNLTYRWVDCDLNAYISGETNSTLMVTRNGKYAVEVSDGICKTMSACVNMTQAGVDENDALNIGVNVYPNPTTGIVTITMSGAQQADVRIFDGSGKLIKTYLNLNSDDSISIEEFATGVYTLQVQTPNGIKMERLMKN